MKKRSGKGSIYKKIRNVTTLRSFKKIICAAWAHEGKFYFICLSRHIVSVTNYFSRVCKVPKEKVRVGTMEDLIKEVIENNTRVLVSIRDGRIIYDPLGLLSSLRINIKAGLMTGTKEAIVKKLLLIKDYVRQIECVKAVVFDNIFTSTVEAAQTAFLLKGGLTLIPRLIPDQLKVLQHKGLDKTHVGYASEIVRMYKDYEHKRIPLPIGKKLDDLSRKAEYFREAVKRIV